MTSLKDAIEESDQFWIDLANGLPEYHGLGAKGELNHMHGKHRSEEWKKDVSDKLKSLYASEENPWSHIDRSGEKNPMWGNHKDPWNKGKKGVYSEESRKKMGRPMSGENKRKNSESQKGRHHSPGSEFKKGHVPWNTGKPCISKRDPQTGRFLPN